MTITININSYFLILICWILIGIWINFKRDWYEKAYEPTVFCWFSVICAPLNFFIVLYSEFIKRDWENDI